MNTQSMGTKEPQLELDNITVQYGSIVGARNISMNLYRGDIVCMVGNNGAGKSSILKGIMGLATISSGSVLLNSKPINAEPTHQRVADGIAIVHEERLIFPTQTVEENLILGAYTRWRKEKNAVLQQIDELFEIFPRLRERVKQPAGNLSGGEQQMLAIARSLLSRPEVLLVDELSLGLAPRIVEQLFEVLLNLNKSGLTILLVEQLAERALTLIDNAIVIVNSEMAYSGKSKPLLEDGKLHRTLLGIN